MPPAPTTAPKRTKAYTTTTGERVTKFSDGTEKRVAPIPAISPVTALPAPVTPPTTNIPVGAIDGAPQGLQLPDLPQISDAAGPAKTAAGAFLEQAQAQADVKLKETETKGSASENKIRELMGLANTESATRDKLEDTRGVTGIEEQMRNAEESIARQIAEIDAFDLQNVTDLEGMRIDGSKRDLSKRTFGAQAAEFNLQRTVERAGMAAGLRATVAGNLALQGNLEAATEQVDKALKAIYDPIKQGLEMEKFFLERNDVRLGEDRAEARELRMKGIDRQFAEIDRANSVVDAAVASGGASPEEIKKMVDLSGDPVEQRNYAMSILARTNSADRALEVELKNIQIDNIRDTIASRGTEEKPLTAAQLTALGYGERLMQSNQVIEEVGSQFTGALAKVTGADWFPNILKSEDRQQFEQAQRNFITAVLRRESGAAIADSEFDNAKIQYFPQSGDSPGVLAQKKLNRAQVEKSVLREGGQDTTLQDQTINDPLGLGLQTTNVNNPLGI